MKKTICLMSFMLMGFVSLFTSCIEGDLYDDLYDDGTYATIFPRKKVSKDIPSNSNISSPYPDRYLNKIIRFENSEGGCCRRTLQDFCDTWGEDYDNLVITAMNN